MGRIEIAGRTRRCGSPLLVMEFRMPRILLAVLAGGALSIAGVVAQFLMKIRWPPLTRLGLQEERDWAL
ncbi:iron chelate uptake ABC transporter family permease subunit [Bacillus licheniformis]|nr:iron chelate uptake ABC transporter family permease subunit [Bacillus licheniformis]